MSAGEAHGVGMPGDIGKRDCAGPALRRIHKVAGPWVLAHIRLSAEPDIKTIKRVIKKRNVDANDLQDGHKRQAGEEFDLVGVCVWTIGGEGVGDEMLQQKCAYGYDAAQRM